MEELIEKVGKKLKEVLGDEVTYRESQSPSFQIIGEFLWVGNINGKQHYVRRFITLSDLEDYKFFNGDFSDIIANEFINMYTFLKEKSDAELKNELSEKRRRLYGRNYG